AIDLYRGLIGPATGDPSGAGDSEPLRSAARFNLGVARAALGLDEEAAQTFSSYLADHPGDPQALLYLGNAYLRLGRKTDARTAYAMFLENPDAGAETSQVQKKLKTHEAPPGAPHTSTLAAAAERAQPKEARDHSQTPEHRR